MELRSYQKEIAFDIRLRLSEDKFVYLSAEVRSGKTLMVLEAVKFYQNVLFITKKKAFTSIESDFKALGYTNNLTLINKESIHKIEHNNFDVVVCDEAHGLFGTFPKPNTFTKVFKKRFGNLPVVMLSGTPAPESYSQLFHQFWISKFAPFSHYTNFYKWAKDFVNIKQANFGYATVNDYSNANYNLIEPIIRPYLITFTQAEAGFTTKINEVVHYVEMKKSTYNLAEVLKADKCYIGASGETIIADTSAKLSQKLHQVYSGTIKLDSGKKIVFDKSKAEFIKSNFKGKLAIFYKFTAEFEALKEVFKDELTNDLAEFNETNKHIALQIVSGREGINLSKANDLIFYNIDFSATSYWQGRDRLTTKDRAENNVHWIFSTNGMEREIYKTVMGKKKFTTKIFDKWLVNTKQK